MSIVLVVDSDSETSHALPQQLRHDGHTVCEATSLGDAATPLGQRIVNVVLANTSIGNSEHGVDLIALLNTVGQSVPVILYTNRPTASEAIRAVKADAHDYLQIPVDSSRLTDAVRLASTSPCHAPAAHPQEPAIAGAGFVADDRCIRQLAAKIAQVARATARS